MVMFEAFLFVFLSKKDNIMYKEGAGEGGRVRLTRRRDRITAVCNYAPEIRGW